MSIFLHFKLYICNNALAGPSGLNPLNTSTGSVFIYWVPQGTDTDTKNYALFVQWQLQMVEIILSSAGKTTAHKMSAILDLSYRIHTKKHKLLNPGQ